MGLLNKLKGELIDIIEWLDESNNTIAHRFERLGNEIKNGAQLTVRESQVAVFINEGKLADVFPPGRYELTTNNLPILSTLKGWVHGFNSPFKAEVYFLNTKRFTNQKWGTPNVFYLRDADFGRVSLRAFGTYTMKINDPVKFIKEVLGTSGDFKTEEIGSELRSLIVTQFIDAIGESKLPLLDMAQNYKDISVFCQKQLGEEFTEYGLEITKFLVSSISLPENLQAKLDEGTGMNMLGDMNKYTQMKTADAMENASKSSGGVGGGMEGMMGMAMMQQMMNQTNVMQNQQTQQTQQNVPPPPPVIEYFVSVNGQQQGPFNADVLKQMIASGQLTKETFVWKQGMSGWVAASEVAEVAALFGATPPPPPPPPPV
ncbi:MAG: SPFH domain-containing protein [Bacteroidales bacterium]|nr:SPFH domain-containing protein [Bacteroidales bacterium]